MTDMLHVIEQMEFTLGDSSAEMKIYIEDLKRNLPCAMAWETLFVDWDGRATVCCIHKETIGNIHEQSAEEIWNGPGAQKVRAAFLAHDYSGCNPRCMILAGRIERGLKISKMPR